MTISSAPSTSPGAIPRRLFIVGDHASIVNALRVALRHPSGVNLFSVTDARHSVRAAVREAEPDIVVVDGLSDAEARSEHFREIREEAPHAHVVLLSAPLDDPALQQVLEAGAVARVAPAVRPADTEPPRSAPGEAWAPITSANGNGNGNGHGNGHGAAVAAPVRAVPEACPLTPRELEILRAAAEGPTNAQIARQLWVTEQTVKFHLSNIYRKLGVSNRTEASRYALMNGWVH
jgi:DNA-binding NarL/FixJ family response regulator